MQKSSKAAPASSRKRGRQSTAGTTASATPAKSAKKPRTSITAQAVAAADDYSDGEAVAGVADEDKKWKPPAGNWEEHIAHIDTIEKTDKGLVCYVQW